MVVRMSFSTPIVLGVYGKAGMPAGVGRVRCYWAAAGRSGLCIVPEPVPAAFPSQAYPQDKASLGRHPVG